MTDSLPLSENTDSANSVKYVILTVSDKTTAATSENNVGIALQKLIQQHQGTVVFYSVIPSEDITTIEKKLRSVIEQNLADIVLTIGGHGIAFKDTTPETYSAVFDLRKPGIINGLSLATLEDNTYDILPRAVCGISNRVLLNGLPGNPSSAVCGLSKCNKALIISLPGDEEGAVRCYEALVPAASFASVLLKDDIPTKVKSFETKEQDQTVKNDSSFKSKVSETSEEENDPRIGMVEDEEALLILRKIVLLNVKKQVETCFVEDAPYRVLAQNVSLTLKSESVKICAHDGYAVGDPSYVCPHKKIMAHVKPGDEADNLLAMYNDPNNHCYQVSAGAFIPKGTDRILSASDVNVTTKNNYPYPPTQYISIQDWKSPGFGLKNKETVLAIHKKGYHLKSVDVGEMALFGVTEVSLFKKPAIAILTGGKKDDSAEEKAKEKVSGSEPNKIIVSSILKKNGFKVINAGFCADKPSSLLEKLSYALSQADVVILQADATSDELKFARPVLQTDLGASVHFSCISMIPQNSTTFASLNWEGVTKLVFVMPGDPYTACLSTILFVLPTLRLMEGVEDYSNENFKVKITGKEGYSINPVKATSFLCAPLSNDTFLQVKIEDINNSTSSKSLLSTLSPKSVLMRIPASSTDVDTISAIPLNNYL